MDNNTFDKKIKEEIKEPEKIEAKVQKSNNQYDVKVVVPRLNIRSKADITSDIIDVILADETITIVHESNGWGKIKNQAGWIMLKHTNKVL